MVKGESSQINKTYVIIAIIIAVAILGFGVMNYISSEKNRQMEQIKIQKAEQARQELKNKEEQEQYSKKQTLLTCLSNADENYSENWFRECKSRGLLTSRCISLHDMTLVEYAKEKNIADDKKYTVASDFYKEKDDCSCRLPQYNADTNDKRLQDDKTLCTKLYGN